MFCSLWIPGMARFITSAALHCLCNLNKDAWSSRERQVVKRKIKSYNNSKSIIPPYTGLDECSHPFTNILGMVLLGLRMKLLFRRSRRIIYLFIICDLKGYGKRSHKDNLGQCRGRDSGLNLIWLSPEAGRGGALVLPQQLCKHPMGCSTAPPRSCRVLQEGLQQKHHQDLLLLLRIAVSTAELVGQGTWSSLLLSTLLKMISLKQTPSISASCSLAGMQTRTNHTFAACRERLGWFNCSKTLEAANWPFCQEGYIFCYQIWTGRQPTLLGTEQEWVRKCHYWELDMSC